MLKKHIVFTSTLAAAFIIQAASASVISEQKSSTKALTQQSIWEKGKGLQGTEGLGTETPATEGPAFTVAANGSLTSSVADSTVLQLYSSMNGTCTGGQVGHGTLSGSMTFNSSNTYRLNKTGLYAALSNITDFTDATMDVKVNPTTQSDGTGLNVFAADTGSPALPACFTVNCTSGTTCTTSTAAATVKLTAPTVVGDFFDEGYVYCLGGSCVTTGPAPTNGEVIAAGDNSTSTQWYNNTFITTAATSSTKGYNSIDGNTGLIIASQGAPVVADYAANLCGSYNSGDEAANWYLPAKNELNLIYANITTLNTAGASLSVTSGYWSSTETNSKFAYEQDFSNGDSNSTRKSFGDSVRCVRAF